MTGLKLFYKKDKFINKYFSQIIFALQLTNYYFSVENDEKIMLSNYA